MKDYLTFLLYNKLLYIFLFVNYTAVNQQYLEPFSLYFFLLEYTLSLFLYVNTDKMRCIILNDKDYGLFHIDRY